jgi:hypothetical protein
MTKQKCGSQNPLIGVRPLSHLYSHKRHSFTISWSETHNSSLQTIYITQILTEAFIEKLFVLNAMNNQTYCSWKHKAIDSLYSTTRQRLIITPLGSNDRFMKFLQQKVPLLKISIPELKSTMRKMPESAYLC